MMLASLHLASAILALAAVWKIENLICNIMKRHRKDIACNLDDSMLDSNAHSHCELCGVECECTKHHLIPVSRTREKYKDIKDDDSNLLWICRQCHDAVHAAFSNTQLRDFYNTREKLLEAEEIKKYVAWKKKHPGFKGHSKMSNARKNHT